MSASEELRGHLRTYRTQPLVPAVAIITTAIGVALAILIYAICRAVLLQPLPFATADDLVRVSSSVAGERDGLSLPELTDLRARTHSAREWAATFPYDLTLDRAGVIRRVRGAHTAANLFSMIGVKPAAGRAFTDADGPGARVAMISGRLAAEMFGTAAAAIGQPLTLNGLRYDVVGVLPHDFNAFTTDGRTNALQETDVWTPLARMQKLMQHNRKSRVLSVVARLREGESIERLNREIAGIGVQLAAEHPETNASTSFRATSLRDEVVGGVRPTLLLLVVAISILLIITWVNVGNVMLAFITARAGEFGIRSALGASDVGLALQVFIETLLLTSIGGAAGALLSWWGVAILHRAGPASIPRIREVAMSPGVVLVAFAVTAVSGLVIGVLPALYVVRLGSRGMLNAGGRGMTADRHRSRGRAALVGFEIAATVVLLSAAAMAANSLIRQQQIETGFDAHDVLTEDVTLSNVAFPNTNRAAQQAYYDALLRRAGAMPGVVAAGIGADLPLASSTPMHFSPSAAAVQQGESPYTAEVHEVSAHFLDALRVPLLRGRGISDRDEAAAPAVVIINAAAARRFYGSADAAIGRSLRFDAESQPRLIVGVAGDVRSDLTGREVPPQLYIPWQQATGWLGFRRLVVRRAAGSALTPRDLVDVPRTVNPAVGVEHAGFLQEKVDERLATSRFGVWLTMLFAISGVLLSGFGLYGVMAYNLTRRRRELAIRAAIGATPLDLFSTIGADTAQILGGGLGAGLLAALAASNVARHTWTGVEALTAGAGFAIAGTIVVVGAIATFVPSLRVARQNPVVALQGE